MDQLLIDLPVDLAVDRKLPLLFFSPNCSKDIFSAGKMSNFFSILLRR